MRADMLNTFFSASRDISFPAPVLYTCIIIIGSALMVNLLIRLVRYLDNLNQRMIRYNAFLKNVGISRAEKICLEHCANDLGVKDKVEMLVNPAEFRRVVEWAGKRHARRILVARVQQKVENYKSGHRRPARSNHHRHLHTAPYAA